VTGGTPLWPSDPQAVGPYTILGRLGEGAMGTVYLACDADGEKVAIKVVRRELARDDVFLRRFGEEARHARRVEATYTARVIAVVTATEHPYLVTEFIDGPTLAELVLRDGPLPPSAAKAVSIGTAAALIAIHDAGVVHRDLKPANVMLSHFGPRVIDFGIARSLSAATRFTVAGSPVGTPAYMSPEQILDEEVTPASDLFSWAGMMVYATTGHLPFGSEEAFGITLWFQIIESEPRIADVPVELRGIIAAALSKDPAARPTARQLLELLTANRISGDPDAVADRALSDPGALPQVATPRLRRRAAAPAIRPAPDPEPLRPGAGPGPATEPGTTAERRAPDSPAAQKEPVSPGLGVDGPGAIRGAAAGPAAARPDAAPASPTAAAALPDPAEMLAEQLVRSLNPRHEGAYTAVRGVLAALPTSTTGTVLGQLSAQDAASVFLDLHNENRGRALTVLDSMPDETVRQLLLAMNFKDRYELSLPRKRQRLLESQESKPGSRAPRRGHQSADAPALNGSDPEIVAAQVDPLSASEAAQAIRQLGPELSGQVLDLLGSRKARSIRKYL
jgi:hypothetical protein